MTHVLSSSKLTSPADKSSDGAKTREGDVKLLVTKLSLVGLYGLVRRDKTDPAHDLTILCFFDIFGSGEDRGLLKISGTDGRLICNGSNASGERSCELVPRCFVRSIRASSELAGRSA